MKTTLYVSTIILLLVASTTLVSNSKVSAQTASPNPTTVVSDYALDVQNGEKDTANDIDAQNNQKGAKENENTEGKEEGENTETNEQVEHQEAVEPKEVENKTEGEGSSVNSNKQESNQASKSGGESQEGKSENGSKQSGDNKQE